MFVKVSLMFKVDFFKVSPSKIKVIKESGGQSQMINLSKYSREGLLVSFEQKKSI